jgi:hypothetical protein
MGWSVNLIPLTPCWRKSRRRGAAESDSPYAEIPRSGGCRTTTLLAPGMGTSTGRPARAASPTTGRRMWSPGSRPSCWRPGGGRPLGWIPVSPARTLGAGRYGRWPRCPWCPRPSCPSPPFCGPGSPRLHALTRTRFFGAVSDRLLISNLKQVRRYFTEPELRDAVRARAAELITSDTRVVVGHSLGSVVAYEVLCALRPERPPLTLVTLGSPLTCAFSSPSGADMLPMTHHVECVAILEPPAKGL